MHYRILWTNAAVHALYAIIVEKLRLSSEICLGNKSSDVLGHAEI